MDGDILSKIKNGSFCRFKKPILSQLDLLCVIGSRSLERIPITCIDLSLIKFVESV